MSYIQGYISSTTPGNGAGNVACASSTGPFCNTQNGTIGDISRVAPYGLRAQGNFRLTMAVSRTFDLGERFKFVFRADCMNVTNHVTFGNNFQNNTIGVNPNTSTFGTVGQGSADSRAFQFQGRLKF
jgi:hypothetical protein